MTKEELDQLDELEQSLVYMLMSVFGDEIELDPSNSILQRLKFITDQINSIE